MSGHSFLTIVSPIEYRQDDPEARLADVRNAVTGGDCEDSPFTTCPMVHMARFQLIDTLAPPMGDLSGQALKTRYLLFIADIDGSVDDFLDCLYRTNVAFVHSVWGRCLGYPAYRGAVFFRRYIHACSFEGALAYAGFPESVQQIKAVLLRKQALAKWASRHQGLSDEALQAAWLRDRRLFEDPASHVEGIS